MVRFLAALAMLGSVGMSSAFAADGCGRGFHWNGWRCAPEHRIYAPRFRAEPAFRGCPRHYEWNPRYGRCTSNFR
jgi:hypothetical protein